MSDPVKMWKQKVGMYDNSHDTGQYVSKKRSNTGLWCKHCKEQVFPSRRDLEIGQSMSCDICGNKVLRNSKTKQPNKK